MALESTHVNVPLSTLSIGYRNSGYVADRVFPIVPVVRDSDSYAMYDLSAFRNETTLRAPRTEARLVHWANTWGTYACDEHALADMIDDKERRNSNVPADLTSQMVERLTDKLLLSREVRVRDLLCSTATWTNSSPTAKWDVAGTDVIGQVKQAVTSVTLLRPNTMVVSRAVVDALEGNTAILDRIKYTQRAVVTEDLLSALFGIPRVLVAEASINTAAEGQTDSVSYVWSDNVWIGYTAERGGLNIATAGLTFQSQALQVRKWREEAAHSDRIEVSHAEDECVVAANLGVLLTGVLT